MASSSETNTSVLPVVDLDLFRGADPASSLAIAECQKASLALQTFGAFVLKTTSVTDHSNTKFLDLFEDYFSQPDELLKKDERPEFGFQVGTTLSNTEKPKCHSNEECQTVIQNLDPEERPLDLTASFADPKCRFFYRMATPPPYPSQFPALAMPNVVPTGFEDRWIQTCDAYGKLLKNAVEGVAEMSAIGFGLDKTTFLDAGKYGPHLLAPTATDLVKYGKPGAIFAGFHTDLNFLTIHGPSRYPGLHIWARNTGKRIVAKVPKVVQAGKQLEILTGGLVRAGFHEVIYNDKTYAAVEQRKLSHPDRPLIRISSTMFWHLSSDFDITPIPSLAKKAAILRNTNGEHAGLKDADQDPYKEWQGVLVGKQVQIELGLINLMA